MKGMFLLASLLVLAIALSGCTTPTREYVCPNGSVVSSSGLCDSGVGTTNAGPAIKNCGADYDCFQEALEKCEPTVHEYENHIAILATVRHEIKGIDEEGCKIYHKQTNPNTGGVIFEKTCHVKDYENAEFIGIVKKCE